MNLLAGKLYDPGTSVNKVTTAALAMTALDTTNLRLAFVVPPSGMVYVRMEGSLHGATTFPQIMLGVLEGSTVKGRVRPKSIMGGTALATTLVDVEALFAVTGLTPGAALTWDAAYGVETLVAATGLKYGGPNNTTANDAFGGFAFEIWDPCPFYTPTAGTPPTTTVHQKIDVIDDFLDTELAAVLVAVDTEVGDIKTKTDQLTFSTANKVDSTIQAAADLAQAAADKVWLTGARVLTAGTNIVLVKGTGVTGFNDLDAAGIRAAAGLASANLDTQLSGINSKTTNLPAAPAAVGDIPTALENADAYLKRDMSAVTGEASRSPLNAFRFLRNGFSISGATLTVLKEDDVTPAFTRTVTTDPAAEPVIGVA